MKRPPMTAAEIKVYRKQWGIPDWRKGTGYPKQLPDFLLRWELLRRDAEYRKDWEVWSAKSIKWRKEHEEPEFTDVWLWFSFWDPDPQSPAFRALMPGSEAKYKLNGLPNPAISNPVNLGFKGPYESDAITPGSVASGNGRRKVLIPKGCMILCIDKALPVLPQMERHKILLERIAESEGLIMRSDTRKRRDYYIRCLRTLDAIVEGATTKEIFETLRPKYRADSPYSAGRDLVKQAQKLRNKLLA